MIQNLPYHNIDISCSSNINKRNIFLINIIHVVVSHMRYQQFYGNKKKKKKKNPRPTDLDGHLSIIARRRWIPQGVSYLDFNLHFGV